MKLFIIVLLSTWLVLALAKKRTEEEIEQLKKWHQECGEDEETKDLLDKARDGNWTDHPKLKQHILCYSKKLGWLNSEGKFDQEQTRENFAKYYEQEQVDKLMRNCIITKETPEDTAIALFQCRQKVLHDDK